MCDKSLGLQERTFFLIFALNSEAILMVPKTYVLSKKMKTIKNQLKIVIFTAVRYHSILNGRVIVMKLRVLLMLKMNLQDCLLRCHYCRFCDEFEAVMKREMGWERGEKKEGGGNKEKRGGKRE